MFYSEAMSSLDTTQHYETAVALENEICQVFEYKDNLLRVKEITSYVKGRGNFIRSNFIFNSMNSHGLIIIISNNSQLNCYNGELRDGTLFIVQVFFNFTSRDQSLPRQVLFIFYYYFFLLDNFFPGLDVMPFPTTPSTRGKQLKSGPYKSP